MMVNITNGWDSRPAQAVNLYCTWTFSPDIEHPASNIPHFLSASRLSLAVPATYLKSSLQRISIAIARRYYFCEIVSSWSLKNLELQRPVSNAA